MEDKQCIDYMEEYYLKNIDDIDKFLWNEFRIMRGCCSSVEELRYSVARAVAEKLWKNYEIQGWRQGQDKERPHSWKTL